MDLKGKLKGFISDSKQKILSPGGGSAEHDSVEDTLSLARAPLGCLADRTMWTDSDREVSQLACDPIRETEVLAELQPEYYHEDWDSSSYWINKLGDKVNDLETIDAARKDLMKQLTTVSRRVFSLILAKQTDYTRQLDHIVKVETELDQGLVTCQTARAGLGTAQRQFVESSLGILASVRRRHQTMALLDQMTKINNIHRTLEKAELLSRDEEWAGAIKLLLGKHSLLVINQTIKSIFIFNFICRMSEAMQQTSTIYSSESDVHQVV